MQWVVILIPVVICTIVFESVAVWCFNSKTPVNFWSGTTVKPEEVNNIRGYNVANGIMWQCFALIFIAAGVAAPFSMLISGIVIFAGVLLGLPAIILIYKKIIMKKYKAE